jgi:hypothetical protein
MFNSNKAMMQTGNPLSLLDNFGGSLLTEICCACAGFIDC